MKNTTKTIFSLSFASFMLSKIRAFGQGLIPHSKGAGFILLVLLVALFGMSGVASAAGWVVGSDENAWVENVTFDNTTVDYDNAKLLNGYNPRNLFWITSGGTSGPGPLGTTSSRHSQSFTADSNKTVRKIGIYFFVRSNATYKVGLQKDNNGFPDGVWIDYGLVTPNLFNIQHGGPDSWYFVTLNNPVTLSKGEHYHIVIQYDSGTIDTPPEIYSVVPINGVIPYNSIGPDKNIDIIDANVYTSVYNGSSWSKQTKGTMVFLLDFNDDTYYGNPWTHGYEWCGDKSFNWYRERIKISLQNKTIRTIGTMMGVRTGDWDGGDSEENWAALPDAHYEISENETTVLREGVVATKDEVKYHYYNYGPGEDRRFAWYEKNLSSPLTLEKNKTYYVYFFAPGAIDPTPIYLVDTFDARDHFLTQYMYGGPNPLAITTWDGVDSYYERWWSYSGSIWKDDGKRNDVSLKFKLVDAYDGKITSITKDAESIGSVGDAWKQIKFEGSVSSGTSIAIEVNSPSCGEFVTVQNNAVSGVTYDLPSCAQERYASWRLALHTDDPSITPEIYNVTLIAAPNEGLSPIDINQDGTIDISDLRLVALHFGETTTSPYPRYDVDANGTVDILDLRQVAGGM